MFLKILKLFWKKNTFIFYSENKNYQNFYKDTIFKLAKKKFEIIYLSSDSKDIINNKNVINLHIGDGIARDIIFKFINCKVFVMTLTDLNNYRLKKSSSVNKYVYIFHSPISINTGYRNKKSFHHYDVFFIPGPNHFLELKKNIETHSKKLFIKTGYEYFNFLRKKKKTSISNKKIFFCVLIAPSWSVSNKNLINNNYISIIELLLKNGHSVIFRPHIEIIKKSFFIIKQIKKKFLNYENFELDLNNNYIESFYKSDVLLSDFSGISLEYALIFYKKVLFLDLKKNKHGNNFVKSSCDQKFIKKFGIKVNKLNINQKIFQIKNNKNYNKNLIKKFANKYFYNFEKKNLYHKELLKLI